MARRTQHDHAVHSAWLGWWSSSSRSTSVRCQQASGLRCPEMGACVPSEDSPSYYRVDTSFRRSFLLPSQCDGFARRWISVGAGHAGHSREGAWKCHSPADCRLWDSQSWASFIRSTVVIFNFFSFIQAMSSSFIQMDWDARRCVDSAWGRVKSGCERSVSSGFVLSICFKPRCRLLVSDSFQAKVTSQYAIDGYRCFYACSEWWVFATPFHAWYSKNVSSVALPLAEKLGVSPGHVTWDLLETFLFTQAICKT